MESPLQSLSVNNIELHYQKSGQGQPLVFVPGSISDYRTWSRIVPRFESQFTCYTISRRYTYPSQYPPGGDGSVAANTDDLARFIEALRIGPARVIGHSYGGYIALSLAIRYPALVSKVVAEEPVFAPALVKNPKNPLQMIGLLLRNFKAGKSFARLGIKGINPSFKALATNDLVKAQSTFIDGVTNGRQTPESLDPLTRQQLADNIAALAGEDPFNTSLTMSDLTAIQCPILLLNGTESPYLFQYINACLTNSIKQSQQVTFQGAGHWIHLQQEAAFTGALQSFLQE